MPGAQAVDVPAVQHDDGDRRCRGERDHRPRLPEQHSDDRQRERDDDRGERRVAEEQEGRRSRRAAPIPPTIGATPRNAPPHVATTLPPRCQRRKSGRQCPSIAAAAGEHAGEMARRSASRRTRATKPFAVSSTTTGSAELPAVDAPHVRRRRCCRSPACGCPRARTSRDEPVPPRHRAEQVAGDDEERRGPCRRYGRNPVLRRPSRSRRPSRGCRRTRRCTTRDRSGSRGSRRARRRRARRAASRSRSG